MKKENKADKKDTYSYRGALMSDSMLKRAFAVFGYVLLAHSMFIAIFFLLFGLLFGLIWILR